MLALGLGLALVASVALNASYLLQHAGSRAAPAIDLRRPVATIASLLRSKWWLVGSLAGLAGWGLHLVALSQAPLSLVNAFAVGGLALTVPVAARTLGHRLTPGDTVAVGLLVVSLALLGLGAKTHRGPETVPVTGLVVALSVAAAAALALVVWPAGSRRAQALGAAGGVLYGAADAAAKAATMAHGIAAAVLSPWAAVVAVASVVALVSFQRGLQLGPAVTVVALMTAGTTTVAVLIGLLAFGDPLGAGPLSGALHAAALAVAVAAAVRLVITQERLEEHDAPG